MSTVIENQTIFKIAILNDLLGGELAKIKIDQVINPEFQSKLRNLQKSCTIFTKFTDDLFKEMKTQETFGEFCDQIDEVVSSIINPVIEE